MWLVKSIKSLKHSFLFYAHISNKKKRVSFSFILYRNMLYQIQHLTIKQSYYSTHQLYLFLSRHISVLIRILYRKTESIHFSKVIIHKWLVKSIKSTEALLYAHNSNKKKRVSFSFLLYRTMLYQIQHLTIKQELLFYSPVASFLVNTYLIQENRRWNVYILAQHNSWIHPVSKTGRN